MTPSELRDLVHSRAGSLLVNRTLIDAPALLCAIAHMETSFGERADATLHEPAYCYGGKYYKASESLRKESVRWGCQAHSSYGPWQLLYITAHEFGFRDDPFLLRSAQISLPLVIEVLNRRVARRFADALPEDFFDAWNSGNARDHIVPAEYITKAMDHYHKEILS